MKSRDKAAVFIISELFVYLKRISSGFLDCLSNAHKHITLFFTLVEKEKQLKKKTAKKKKKQQPKTKKKQTNKKQQQQQQKK